MANDDWKRLERNCSKLLLQPPFCRRDGSRQEANGKQENVWIRVAWIENCSVDFLNGTLLDEIENFKSGSICEKKIVYKIVALGKRKKGLWIRIRKFYIDSWNENDLSDNLPLACAYPFIVNQTKMCYICFKIAVTFPDMGLQRTHYLFRW